MALLSFPAAVVLLPVLRFETLEEQHWVRLKDEVLTRATATRARTLAARVEMLSFKFGRL